MSAKLTTVIIGASAEPTRYSYLAANKLCAYNHPIIPLGKKAGRVAGVNIQTDKPTVDGVDTVTLYINPRHQPEWYDYVLGLKPRRVIFNPGTENDEFEGLLKQNGIAALEACTLVMLSTGQF